MTKITLIMSIFFKIVALGLTVLCGIQTYDAIIKENRFLFFQILLIFVWGMGALLFWIVGITLGKSYKKGMKGETNI